MIEVPGNFDVPGLLNDFLSLSSYAVVPFLILMLYLVIIHILQDSSKWGNRGE